jgi:hypothetical protein
MLATVCLKCSKVSDSFLAKDDPDSLLSLFPFYRLLKSLDFILTYLGRVTSISNTLLLHTIFSKIKETVRRYLSNKVCFIKVNTGIKISFYLEMRLFYFCLVTAYAHLHSFEVPVLRITFFFLEC